MKFIFNTWQLNCHVQYLYSMRQGFEHCQKSWSARWKALLLNHCWKLSLSFASASKPTLVIAALSIVLFMVFISKRDPDTCLILKTTGTLWLFGLVEYQHLLVHSSQGSILRYRQEWTFTGPQLHMHTK